MQPTMKILVSLFLLSSVLANVYQSGAKLRRDGVLNLFPFPRVGRSSHSTWSLPYVNAHSDYEPYEKRQLYAFPRVGRRDVSLQDHQAEDFQSMKQLGDKRADSPAMWFGPRVGRSFRRSDDDITIQNENRERSEQEQVDTFVEERKKRHTKLY